VSLTEVQIDSNIHLGRERFAKVIKTTHAFISGEAAVVQTALHTDDEPHTAGGMRIVTRSAGDSLESDVEGRLREVGSLSSAMTYKCDLTGLPCGGQKTVALYTGSLETLSAEDRADLLAQHISEVVQHAPNTLFGPDMAVGEEVQDIIVSRYPHLAKNIIGVSENHGGLSIDKYGYTAQGVKAAIDFARDSGALQEGKRAVIAGFGAVGAHTAELLHNDEYPVVAISNRFGTIHNSGKALPIDSLFEVWNQWHLDTEKGETPTASGADEAVIQRAKELGLILKENDTKALLSFEAEILVLAARTKEIGASQELEELRKENPESISIDSVFGNTSLRVIAEGANAPLGELAEEEALAKGVMILPDTAINGGGVKGCYEGWSYRTQSANKAAQQDPLDYRKAMFREIHEQVKTNLSEIHQQLQARGGTLREAMLLVAQRRSAKSI
jgi:glutamate dehydrogenase (NAD(P)+)